MAKKADGPSELPSLAGILPPPGLTLKQERFAVAIVNGAESASEAARIAGYADNAENAVSVTAGENLRKPSIRERILELAQAAGITAEKTLGNVAKKLNSPKFQEMAWATDRSLDILGLRGANRGGSDGPKTQINVFTGSNPAAKASKPPSDFE